LFINNGSMAQYSYSSASLIPHSSRMCRDAQCWSRALWIISAPWCPSSLRAHHRTRRSQHSATPNARSLRIMLYVLCHRIFRTWPSPCRHEQSHFWSCKAWKN